MPNALHRTRHAIQNRSAARYRHRGEIARVDDPATIARTLATQEFP